MPRPLPTVGFWILAFLLGAPNLRGEGIAPTDWPHLRGPNHDAVSPEKGLIEAWPEGGPPVLWSQPLGQGYSGFVAVAGRVYTQFQSRAAQYVISLDADTGAERWRQRVDWAWRPAGAYPGPFATPTWHAGRLYYSTPAGLVGCLNAEDGRPLWSVNIIEKFKGVGAEFGYAATPFVEDGRVILPVGGPGASVVALDARDGSTLWAAGDDPASYCPIYPITYRGRRLVVAFLRNSLAVSDPATGKRIWRWELSTHYDEHSAWPLYVEPDLLIASPFRVGAQLFRLDGAAGEIHPRWASRELSNDVCSSVLVDGCVYGFDLHQLQSSAHRPSRGRFKCLDFATGKKCWETDKVGQASVLAADGKLILLNDSGTLILARAAPTRYDELARARVLDGGLCWTPPTLWHGRLFVRNQSRAVCVFLSREETLEPAGRSGAAAPQGPSFDWTWLLSREADYPHDAPSPGELALWFACCLGIFATAGGAAGLVGLAARARQPRFWADVTCAAVAFLLGLAGTTVLGAWADAFILTWPASLFVAFRTTLAVVAWAEMQPAKGRARFVSWSAAMLFLGVCFGYYQLCLAVGYVMAWSFLAGFPAAAPAALLAVRARKAWLRVIADVVAFSVYFWVGGMLPAWKSRWFG